MSSPPPYAELHCHSAFSLLDGTTSPEDLVAHAAVIGLHSLALTDHDDLGGAVRFADAGRRQGLPALIGAELTVTAPRGALRHLTLIAESARGYGHICALVTQARGTHTRGCPTVDLDTLDAHSDGLICLSGCSGHGLLARPLAEGDTLGARRLAGQLSSIFGDRFAVEVMDHALPEERALAGALVELADRMALPWVVTHNVHHLRPRDRVLHDVVTCLRHHTTLDEAGDRLRPSGEWCMKTPEQMARRWAHDLRGIAHTVAIAERCTFRLDQLAPALPDIELPEGVPDADAWLSELTWAGVIDRWGEDISPRHRQQVEHELSLIARRGLAPFFLIVWDIVRFARGAHILVQGRGSAANSAVCYCLGITAVDPIRFDLLFERFLSDARGGYPDIDLDIAHNQREEVIQYVYRRYGRDRAAMVCEHTCFRARGSVRDVSRVLGLSAEDGGRIAKAMGRAGPLRPEHIAEAGLDPQSKRMHALRHVVQGLEGLPRHRSIHVGGFVLTAGPVSHVVPIEPAAMADRTIIQWDKDDLEPMGLVKFDLLGLGMLTAIDEGLRHVEAATGEPTSLYDLPQDPQVYDMICAADTVGVFQIESRAQMNVLPRTRPRTFYDLAVQVALIRPGPLQGDMVHPYIRRRRGEEAPRSLHPSLEPVLARTLGVPLFQEQGMKVAITCAGFSPSEADALRRAMSSRHKTAELQRLMDRLREGMATRGIDPADADRIVGQIEGFAHYGFPESHSTSFALLVYASAWLKRHHPAAFLCALLNGQPMGFYSPSTLVHDARRHGVKVLGPCVQSSIWHSRILSSGAVRLGLRLVDGLGPRAKACWQRLRSPDDPWLMFDDIADLAQRTAWPASTLGILADAGALDALVPAHIAGARRRRHAIWSAIKAARTAPKPIKGDDLTMPLPLPLAVERPVEFPPQTALERLAADQRTTGVSSGAHPVHHVRQMLDDMGATPSHRLNTVRGHIWVGGMVISRQRPSSAKGFFFLTLEDEWGFINVIVRPEVFEAHRSVLRSARCLAVWGRLAREQGVFNLLGRRFEVLALDASVTLSESHDFR
ncbi:MAG: DNA polymerase III subunit alpha [Bradymonadia bacterium]